MHLHTVDTVTVYSAFLLARLHIV